MSHEEIQKALDAPAVVEKAITPIPDEPIGETLTPRQRKFCELYALNMDYFGNGVQSYLEVYDIDKSKPAWYKTACTNASRLLSNAKVCNHINELLDSEGLNDEFVDKQLLSIITQHDDRTNKLGAIKEYNKLKQRIIEKSESSLNVTIADEVKMKKLNDLKERLNITKM